VHDRAVPPEQVVPGQTGRGRHVAQAQEAVDQTGMRHVRDVVACLAHKPGQQAALVPERVVPVRRHHGGRKPAQVGVDRAERRIVPVARVGDPLLDEPAQVVGVQPPAVALLLHAGL
jgi:hypothetical protein